MYIVIQCSTPVELLTKQCSSCYNTKVYFQDLSGSSDHEFVYNVLQVKTIGKYSNCIFYMYAWFSLPRLTSTAYWLPTINFWYCLVNSIYYHWQSLIISIIHFKEIWNICCQFEPDALSSLQWLTKLLVLFQSAIRRMRLDQRMLLDVGSVVIA